MAKQRIAQDSNGKVAHGFAMVKHSMTQRWLRQQGSEEQWKGSVEICTEKIYQEKRRKK